MSRVELLVELEWMNSVMEREDTLAWKTRSWEEAVGVVQVGLLKLLPDILRYVKASPHD